jgi:hypothetical protein
MSKRALLVGINQFGSSIPELCGCINDTIEMRELLRDYSHGTQVDDQSDDGWECLDEVIVPYDHDWEDPFRDDELRAIFNAIPEGVNFTFIADCCHSGSIQKALVDSSLRFYPRYLTPPPEVADRILAKREKRDAEANA